MRRSIWKRIEEILQKHVLHGKWVRAVIALACVVIYITTYVLIMPAVTLARATECGQEEHTHTEDCYETETELTCGREEHTHTDDCYDEEGNLICGMEEHVHDDSCYTSREVLICGQEEHVHTEDCYAQEEVIQEDIPEEAEEEEQEEFTVENEEEQPQAGDTVMEPAGTAAPEQLSQIRFRDYLTDWTTLYYAPEDGDNWQPLAEDKWHSLYQDNWGIRRSDTADRGLDPEEYVLLHIGYRIPAGQINATNPEAEFILPLSIGMTEEEVRDNNKYYYSLFSGTDREADELFVDGEYEIKEEWNSDGEVTQRKLVITFNEDACLRCGGEKLTDGTETLAAEELEGFFELRVKAEDLLTLKKIEEASYVLEWNEEAYLDTVVRFDPKKLAAYYGTENADDAEAETEGPVSGELRAEGKDYTITVSYTEEAGLPADVSLKVKEITGKKEYESYKAQMEEELIDPESTQVTGARFFDITLEDSEGNELHPESGVRVLIETKDTLQENEKVQICHFDEEKDKPVEVESREVTGGTYEKENLGVEFEAESFSVYGVVYTVDFEYSVNGKIYQFSLPGGGFVSFTDLIEVLGITGDTNSENYGDENGSVIAESGEENAINEGAEENGSNSDKNTALTLGDVEVSEATKKFVGDVASVEFSNPELVDVSKIEADTTVGQIKENHGLECEYSEELTEEQIVELNAQTVKAGDWALISVQPFTSEESLTVTMKNGEQFTIKVTDGQLHTYVISDSDDTYEIIVTYDDSAEIPADAELRVRQIQSTDDVFAKNVEATNKELLARDASEVVNPVQFDIAIISNGKEIEPKKGSIVNVEIRLVPEVFGLQTEDAKENESSADDAEAEAEDNAEAETGEGEIWFSGEKVLAAEGDEETHYTVSHITDDGRAEVIEGVSCSVNEEEKIVLQFETESFSDYLVDTDSSSNNTLSRLPTTLYVGDVIYLYDHANYSVSGSGYTDVHINNNNKFREVRATSTGTFTITAPAWTEYVGWSQIYHPAESKTITVQPARTGTTPPATIDTVDNASIGLTMNLFDYDLDNSLDSYFNNFNHNDHPVAAAFANEWNSINDGHALKFWGSGIGGNYGTANQYDAHLVNSIVQNTLAGGVGGYPQLTANSNPGRSTESLEYLFSPSSGTDKEAYTNVNGLFKKQGDYFIYDSNENYAYYDKSQGNGGSFAVYERTYEQKSRDDGGEQATHTNGKTIGFFPFHKWDEGYDQYVNWNKTLNHHFGISMSVPFSMPKAPKAVLDTKQEPIIFEFSGDDDLWVFIDGKLAMDIGGIHQPTSGTIDFTNRTVTVNGNSQYFDFSNLYDGEKHTLQVFYLERGGCDSNCKIMFNLTQYGDVEFDKVDADDNSVLLPGAVFGLYKDAACTEPLMEKLDAAHGNTLRSFTVETDEHGHAKLEDVPLGDYYLKEIHAPDGYPLTVGAEAARVRVYLDASGNVKVSVNGTESGAKITNKKPSPIDLGLKKEWQDADEQTVPAPDGVTAAFEIKRMRTYEIYTEEKIEGEGRQSSHLTVGWIHDDQSYEYEEFDLVAGSHVAVSWSYADDYEGTVGYRLNGTDYTKPSVPTNIYSQGFDMPAADQNAVFYIFDDSENGEAISNINVAGSQFYGNSGGGYVHTFHQITEPDPEFTYTGENVTDNKVTLPINESTWQYLFENLPVFGSGTVRTAIEQGGPEQDYDVTFHYSYYLEEVSNTAPEGTTVIYKNLSGNVISSLTDAETSVSGTETIINRIPFGYLKIEKKVTYNGSDQNLTSEQKSKLAGEYKFKIYTKEQCADADAVQDPDAPDEAEDKDLIVTINIGTDGQAVSSSPIRLLAGNYWIKEVESSNPMMFPVQNPIAAAVTKDHTTSSPVIKTLTNNYDENNGPDKISIDIEKIFQGLDSPNQVPSDFQVLLQYKVNGETKNVTLQNRTATGENGETITWSESSDGFTWHWKVGNIDNTATDFKIKEINQDNATGYDWKSAFLNGTGTENNITSTVTEYHDLTVTAPMVEFGDDVKTQRITSDSEYDRAFFLLDDDILLTSLTSHQGSLVISKKPLNLSQRKAVEEYWPGQGSIKKPPIYFSIEEHPDGFTYGDKTIKFGEKDGKTVVKFTSNASSNEAIFVANYTSQEALNIANLANTYEEVPIPIDIIKFNKDNTSQKLPGAVFTLRQLADEAPTNNGTIKTLAGTTPTDSAPTDSDGKTSFSNLTHGYYEISEKTAPVGYILSAETTFYFKIESGEVTWLVKGTGKPSQWAVKEEVEEGDMVGFEAAHPGTGTQSATNDVFTVGNTPGAALPNTGGPGTRIFTILGSILIFGAGLVWMRKRRRAEFRTE